MKFCHPTGGNEFKVKLKFDSINEQSSISYVYVCMYAYNKGLVFLNTDHLNNNKKRTY